MDGYSYSHVFQAREIRLLAKAEAILKALPETSPDGPLRCHEVARVVGKILNLEVQDGQYGFSDHSWCWTSKLETMNLIGRTGFPNILDPYCVGKLPIVQLIYSGNPGIPHVGWSYRPGEFRTDIDVNLVDFLVNELKTTLAVI